jgi:hypothetical protein
MKGWRGEGIPMEVSPQIRAYFTSPMEVTYSSGGRVESIRVQDNLPLWAENIKKAQVSQFVVDAMGENRMKAGGYQEENNSIRSQNPPQSYRTNEETVLGDCGTQYEFRLAHALQAPYPYLKANWGQGSSSSDSSSRSQEESAQEQGSEEDQNQDHYQTMAQNYVAYKGMVSGGKYEDVSFNKNDLNLKRFNFGIELMLFSG